MDSCIMLHWPILYYTALYSASPHPVQGSAQCQLVLYSTYVALWCTVMSFVISSARCSSYHTYIVSHNIQCRVHFSAGLYYITLMLHCDALSYSSILSARYSLYHTYIVLYNIQCRVQFNANLYYMALCCTVLHCVTFLIFWDITLYF